MDSFLIATKKNGYERLRIWIRPDLIYLARSYYLARSEIETWIRIWLVAIICAYRILVLDNTTRIHNTEADSVMNNCGFGSGQIRFILPDPIQNLYPDPAVNYDLCYSIRIHNTETDSVTKSCRFGLGRIWFWQIWDRNLDPDWVAYYEFCLEDPDPR